MTYTCFNLIVNEIMPIIRFDLVGPGVGGFIELPYEDYAEYAASGVRYFELYDAVNDESTWWSPAHSELSEFTWENTAEVIGPLMDTWIAWAERIIGIGGYPAFPALTQNTNLPIATVYWQN